MRVSSWPIVRAHTWELDATTNDIVQVNGNLTLGSANTYTVLVSKVGTPVAPSGDYVLIAYSGADPAPADLGSWTMNMGATGWPQGNVFLDDAGAGGRVMLRMSSTKGTMVLIR